MTINLDRSKMNETSNSQAREIETRAMLEIAEKLFIKMDKFGNGCDIDYERRGETSGCSGAKTNQGAEDEEYQPIISFCVYDVGRLSQTGLYDEIKDGDFESHIQHLQSLEKLDIESVNIPSVDLTCLAGKPLRYLSLFVNEIRNPHLLYEFELETLALGWCGVGLDHWSEEEIAEYADLYSDTVSSVGSTYLSVSPLSIGKLRMKRLQHLEIRDYPGRLELELQSPAIEHIRLQNCSGLTSVNCGGKKLKYLMLPESESLTEVCLSGASLKKIDFLNCSQLTKVKIDNESPVEELNLLGCQSLEDISFLGSLKNLAHLVIDVDRHRDQLEQLGMLDKEGLTVFEKLDSETWWYYPYY